MNEDNGNLVFGVDEGVFGSQFDVISDLNILYLALCSLDTVHVATATKALSFCKFLETEVCKLYSNVVLASLLIMRLKQVSQSKTMLQKHLQKLRAIFDVGFLEPCYCSQNEIIRIHLILCLRSIGPKMYSS